MDLSIVVPVYNEEEVILDFYKSLKSALAVLNLSKEVIFINDGSKDKTLSILTEIQKSDQTVKVINFKGNFGQTQAMQAGFDISQGDIVVTLDADMQNDPIDIPLLLENIKDYDVVCGWRHKRKDDLFLRKIPSTIANALISAVTGVKLHDYGCSLKAFRKDVAKNLDLFGDMHRFIPAIAKYKGASIKEVPVSHHERKLGKSKYGISRIIPVILDLITVKFFMSFSKNPMRGFGTMGIGSSIAGIVILFYMLCIKIFFNKDIWGRPLLLLGILLALLGIQLIAIGLLGEMIARNHASKDKPIYSIKEILG